MDKTQFKSKANEAIDAIFDKAEQLDRRRASLNDNLKHQYDQQMTSLKQRKKDVQDKFNELQNAGNEKWEEARQAFSSSFEHYKAGFDELTRLFK